MGNICVKCSTFSCTPYICLVAVFVFPQGFLGRCVPWRAVSHVHDSKRVRSCVILTLFMLTLVFVDAFGVFFQAVPPPSLAGDLGGVLGSMEHADVKFVAGGRPIYAHRAVLSCESEYFDAMFRFRCAPVCAFQRRRSRHVSGWEKATNIASGG